jgi:hypothetical protein
LRDEDLASRLGIHQTPTFIVLIANHPPISATQRSLPRILNSSVALTELTDANLPVRIKKQE